MQKNKLVNKLLILAIVASSGVFGCSNHDVKNESTQDSSNTPITRVEDPLSPEGFLVGDDFEKSIRETLQRLPETKDVAVYSDKEDYERFLNVYKDGEQLDQAMKKIQDIYQKMVSNSPILNKNKEKIFFIVGDNDCLFASAIPILKDRANIPDQIGLFIPLLRYKSILNDVKKQNEFVFSLGHELTHIEEFLTGEYPFNNAEKRKDHEMIADIGGCQKFQQFYPHASVYDVVDSMEFLPDQSSNSHPPRVLRQTVILNTEFQKLNPASYEAQQLREKMLELARNSTFARQNILLLEGRTR